jgi:hypothetical protein
MQPYDSQYNPTDAGIFDIPETEYRRIRALNISYAKLFHRSPAHVRAAIDEPFEETLAMRQGTAFHWRMLEPSRWESEIAVEPGWNKNSNKYKAWAAEQAGKLLLSAKDYQNTDRMHQVASGKQSVGRYLSAGYPEKSLLWFEPEYGIWCKGRIDWVTPGGRELVDLKKTQVATRWAFEGAIRRYHYNHQAAHYLRGFRAATGISPVDWIWICAEIDPPHECRVFAADPAAVATAEMELEEWYQRFAICEEIGDWPGYPDEVVRLGGDYFTDEHEPEDINF